MKHFTRPTIPEGATDNERRAAMFDALCDYDVSPMGYEKKGLTFVPWAIAWREFKKIYPDASYRVIRNPVTGMPFSVQPRVGYMVSTEVTADGVTLEMWMPVFDRDENLMMDEPYTQTVFDHAANRDVEVSVASADMQDVNRALMRCLVKNLAMFGFGLKLYTQRDDERMGAEEVAGAVEVREVAVEQKVPSHVRPTRTRTSARKAAAAPEASAVQNRAASVTEADIRAVRTMDELEALHNSCGNDIDLDPKLKAVYNKRRNQMRLLQAA